LGYETAFNASTTMHLHAPVMRKIGAKLQLVPLTAWTAQCPEDRWSELLTFDPVTELGCTVEDYGGCYEMDGCSFRFSELPAHVAPPAGDGSLLSFDTVPVPLVPTRQLILWLRFRNIFVSASNYSDTKHQLVVELVNDALQQVAAGNDFDLQPGVQSETTHFASHEALGLGEGGGSAWGNFEAAVPFIRSELLTVDEDFVTSVRWVWSGVPGSSSSSALCTLSDQNARAVRCGCHVQLAVPPAPRSAHEAACSVSLLPLSCSE
jgi:hypothetical protein